MRHFPIRFSPVLFLLLLAGCLQAQDQTFDQMLDNLLSHNVPEVKVSELVKDDVLFVDARAYEEFEVSHIKGAKWIGYGSSFTTNCLKGVPKNQKIIVYCTVGYRSEKITEKLIKLGYTNVSNLYGGIFSWKNTGNHVVNMTGNLTQRVHTYNKKWSKWLEIGEKVW